VTPVEADRPRELKKPDSCNDAGIDCSIPSVAERYGFNSDRSRRGRPQARCRRLRCRNACLLAYAKADVAA